MLLWVLYVAVFGREAGLDALSRIKIIYYATKA